MTISASHHLPPPYPASHNPELVLIPPPLELLPTPSPSEVEEGGESSCHSPDPLLAATRRNGPDCQENYATDKSHEGPLQLLQPPRRPPLPPSSPRPPLRVAQPPLLLMLRPCGDGNGLTKKKWQARRRVAAVAGCVRSALGVVGTLFAAAVAVLIAFWSLFPLCTACTSSVARSSSSAIQAKAAAFANSEETPPYSTLRINQLQVIGTHNSYHRRSGLPVGKDLWPYHYPSLSEQLDAGARHLELDVHYDWKTGRWFVYHISVVDPLSTCHCLSSCLEEIRVWSDLNPNHHILFMDIELKLTGDFLRICGANTPDTDRDAFRSLQATVLDAFPPERVFTPSELRGDYDTLYDAITAGGTCNGDRCSGTPRNYTSMSSSNASDDTSGNNVGAVEMGTVAAGVVDGLAGGWPRVDDTRGMILFVMDYQTVNLDCRDGIREALPLNETVFFERIPTNEVRRHSPFSAFTQACQCTVNWRPWNFKMFKRGYIIRQHPATNQWVDRESAGPTASVVTGNETFLADTPAQLLVSDDLIHLGTKGVCRSRCTPMVPEEECILEGFC